MNARLIADPSARPLAPTNGREQVNSVPQTFNPSGTSSSSNSLSSLATSSPGKRPVSVTPTHGSGTQPDLLFCVTGTNWCDVSCWQSRFCPNSGDYTWCYADAYDGASANDNDNFNDGWADVCGVIGYPQFNLSSDSYGGSWIIYPQYDRYAYTSYCGITWPVIICGDQNIYYSVTGGGSDYFRFAGYFNDSDP